MPQLAAFVDFGYLKAQGVKAIKADRHQVFADPQACVDWFRGLAVNRNCSLLRIYWYDGAYDSGHQRHQAQQTYFNKIAICPGITMRLGHLQEITPPWQGAVKGAVKKCGIDLGDFEKHFRFQPILQQKGVDTRLVLDLVRLAQRGAYDVAVLVAGDRDLAEAVRAVQDEGRIVVLAHPGPIKGSGVATELRHIADEVNAISDVDLRKMLQVKT